LAGALAHELYHRTQPFGPVVSSLYEEYWAYYVGAKIAHIEWLKFDGYDPDIGACLRAWFVDHAHMKYLAKDIYPITLKSEVDTTSEVCIP
jgi:hypothetical protein